MNDKIIEMRTFLGEGKGQMQQKIDELVADERKDEARVYRACLNIYDIMETLLNASMKTAGYDEILFKEEFHKLVTRVPASWKVSLEKAKEHDDYEKVMMEEAKLGVVAAVVEKFDALF